ncbi:MAG: hypothetical protein KF683_24355 [Rubrivivax sp.]|nr:hypothetical protein [Rubrivivax sp.]
MTATRHLLVPNSGCTALPAVRRAARLLAAAAVACGAWLLAVPAAAQGMCPGEPLCRQVPRFTATVTDFRVSPNTLGNRPINLSVRFTNRSDRPLVLGYVAGSAAAHDDRGNKYTLQNSAKLTGIGIVERNRFDPKFTLAPGESADARMEINFHVGRNVAVGTAFDLEMSVREIDALPGNQFRLGREHALSWQSLAHGAGARAPGRAAAAAATPAAPAAQPAPAGAPAAPAPVAAAPPGDPCAGVAHCTASGPLAARIVGVASAARKGNDHEVTVRVAFQNTGGEPLLLNYKHGTGAMLDERGQKYTVGSVQGMPISTRDRAGSQFTLQPGESRTAAFIYSRFVGNVPPGTVFAPTMAVEQYALMPSGQLRLAREHALGFGEVRGGADPRQLGEAVKDLRKLLRGKN